MKQLPAALASTQRLDGHNFAQKPTKKVAQSLHVFEDNIRFSWFNGQLLSTY